MMMKRTRLQIGTIISGSLSEGLVMRVSGGIAGDTIKTGKFVSIIGSSHTFFSLITDLTLGVTNPDILLFPPGDHEGVLTEVLAQQDMYTTAQLKPMLALAKDGAPSPVKTIPAHFSRVYEASPEEVAAIFGSENEPSKRYFMIGSPLDMNTPVCLDLEKLTERSNGIFGKTGTGKTFLTRLVLAGLIKQRKAVTIIFDMHSEYGLQARKEGNQHSFVKGLKTLFPDRVALFSLDPASTRRRGGNPDVSIFLTYQDIQVEDILSLQQELNLHATAMEAAYLLATRYKAHWLHELLTHGDSLKEFAQDLGAHPESLAALYRKLKRIEHLPFFVPAEPGSSAGSVVDRMMEYVDKGVSIVIEFGNNTSSFVYLLVANIITRRIHAHYTTKTELFLGSQRPADEPQKLMITIEEAHKFLNPTTARQTIFGTIAREMRKYYVSLLVVDQRPSGIDQEVLSQIGTKIVAALNDEKDIQAVLTGVNNATSLRSILACLDTKKQALCMGHALAMPVVVQTREYDESFYHAMLDEVACKPVEQLVKELF